MSSKQTVLITGAGRGIGAAIARRYADAGAHVVVADIDIDTATATAAQLDNAVAVQLDVTDANMVRAVVSHVVGTLGHIDVLVNNATVCQDADFAEISLAHWEREIAVNLTGPFLCSQAVLEGMAARGSGVITNLSSVNAVSYFGNEAYSAAKAGLLSLTHSIAVKYGSQGIRCNAVIPATIQTPVWDARLAADPEAFSMLTKWYPLGRVGTVQDVAGAVLFLSSVDAGWITGVALPVDGGLLAGNQIMANEVTGARNSRTGPPTR